MKNPTLFSSYMIKVRLSVWCHHFANLYIWKTWISLEQKEIFQNSKQHFSSHAVYLFMFQNGLDRNDAIFVIVPNMPKDGSHLFSGVRSDSDSWLPGFWPAAYLILQATNVLEKVLVQRFLCHKEVNSTGPPIFLTPLNYVAQPTSCHLWYNTIGGFHIINVI